MVFRLSNLIALLFASLLIGASSLVYANNIDRHVERKAPTSKNLWRRNSLYGGVSLGYGSTDWSLITTKNTNSNLATMSTPIKADDKGLVWGFFLGYQITKHFGLEAYYSSYPETKLIFAEGNYYFPGNKRNTAFSETSVYGVIARAILEMNNKLSGFIDFGMAIIHRKDKTAMCSNTDTFGTCASADLKKVNAIRVSPTFGAGVTYNITKKVISELGFQYTAGYGQSNMTPVFDYIPFLYSVYFRLGYRFT